MRTGESGSRWGSVLLWRREFSKSTCTGTGGNYWSCDRHDDGTVDERA